MRVVYIDLNQVFPKLCSLGNIPAIELKHTPKVNPIYGRNYDVMFDVKYYFASFEFIYEL